MAILEKHIQPEEENETTTTEHAAVQAIISDQWTNYKALRAKARSIVCLPHKIKSMREPHKTLDHEILNLQISVV